MCDTDTLLQPDPDHRTLLPGQPTVAQLPQQCANKKSQCQTHSERHLGSLRHQKDAGYIAIREVTGSFAFFIWFISVQVKGVATELCDGAFERVLSASTQEKKC